MPSLTEGTQTEMKRECNGEAETGNSTWYTARLFEAQRRLCVAAADGYRGLDV